MTKRPGYTTLAEVVSSDGRETWTVAQTPKGGFSCNCGRWIFKPICLDCGAVLDKMKVADKTRWWCPSCRRERPRGCKHIVAYLHDEGALRPAGHSDDRLVKAMLQAASAEGVLDRLTEWQWRSLVTRIAPTFADASPAPVSSPPALAPGTSGLRRIIMLE